MIVGWPSSPASFSTVASNSLPHVIPTLALSFRQLPLVSISTVRLNSRRFSGLQPLASLFAASLLCFQWVAASLGKNPGVGYPWSGLAASLRRPAFISDVVTRFHLPFVFMALQIPLPASPLYSHPYKTPGVCPQTVGLGGNFRTTHYPLLTFRPRMIAYETC